MIDLVPILLALHIDEVHNDDPADPAEFDLVGDFSRCLEIIAQDRLFLVSLADEPPAADADAVYLPGGYPELHAGRIAAARRFLAGLREAAKRGALVYGECGGYMTLGQGLVDQSGAHHAMAGLLPLESSFAARQLHLGYRVVRLLCDAPWADRDQVFRGHEFHYACVIDEGEGEPLFASHDARGAPLGPAGRRAGRVMGSFVHLIDLA